MKIIIKNAKLLSMAEINYEIKDILIENGKITAIGKIDEKEHKKAKIIDAEEAFVTPGIIDPHTHVGMFEEAIGFEGEDGNESTNPLFPELRAIDAIKPQDMGFKDALEAGVTTVATGPGSANLIGGTFCILKTFGKTIDDMILVKESAMKMALGENPKRVYNSKNQAPRTRMASAALIREALTKARDYQEKLEKYEKDLQAGKDVAKPEFNMKWASLSRVFKGLPVKIHAHQQDDIVTAIRIKEEFDLDMTIEHATEGYLIPEYLKEHKQSVIIGPLLSSRTKYELRFKTFAAGKILHDAGVRFAIMTDHPVIPIANALTQVALFVKEGLDELDAFKAVTIEAARLNHVADRVGSIEVGKDADIVVWDGHPFHYMTKPRYVLVDGNIAYKR